MCPSFAKSPADLVERFLAVLPNDSSVERRQVFGYPCCFVRGNMATGLFGDRMFVRLSSPDQAIFLDLPGAEPFSPMPGRTMKEYFVLPPDLIADAARLRLWVGKAIAYASSLPRKVDKKGTSAAGKHAKKRR